MNESRRKAFLLVGASAVALAAASCTQTQVDDFAKKLADIVTQIQGFVANACSSVGKWVPTASSVLNVLISFIGPLLGSADLVKVTQDIITKVGQVIAATCPTSPPTSLGAAVTQANGVDVHWY